jgi:large subunit ribosomal protein L35
MPKIKTKKSAAKRFHITSTGKILHRSAYVSHLLEWKKAGRKRKNCKRQMVSKSDQRIVRLMLPYG